jgi:hypothetical protein
MDYKLLSISVDCNDLALILNERLHGFATCLILCENFFFRVCIYVAGCVVALLLLNNCCFRQSSFALYKGLANLDINA